MLKPEVCQEWWNKAICEEKTLIQIVWACSLNRLLKGTMILNCSLNTLYIKPRNMYLWDLLHQCWYKHPALWFCSTFILLFYYICLWGSRLFSPFLYLKHIYNNHTHCQTSTMSLSLLSLCTDGEKSDKWSLETDFSLELFAYCRYVLIPLSMAYAISTEYWACYALCEPAPLVVQSEMIIMIWHTGHVLKL